MQYFRDTISNRKEKRPTFQQSFDILFLHTTLDIYINFSEYGVTASCRNMLANENLCDCSTKSKIKPNEIFLYYYETLLSIRIYMNNLKENCTPNTTWRIKYNIYKAISHEQCKSVCTTWDTFKIFILLPISPSYNCMTTIKNT